MDDPKTEPQLLERSRSFVTATERIAGFELPTATKTKFSAFNDAVMRAPRLPVLSRLAVEGGSRTDWLTRFTNAALVHVPEGLGASYYHIANIESMEREIIAVALAALRELKMSMYSSIAVGNTRKLDFEYQAFAFAMRRTMEYFAKSVAAFFKREARSVRVLGDSIDQAEPVELSKRLRVKLTESLRDLSDLLPLDDSEWSVRDLLGHKKAIPAGVVNISVGRTGTIIGIFGGGENILPWNTQALVEPKHQKEGNITFARLAPVLQDQASRVEGMIFGIYGEMGLIT